MNAELGTIDNALPEKNCLQLASELEHQLLPQQSPDISGAGIAGWSLYSSKIGGDFFDYHDFKGVCCPSSDHMRIVVGDASGHGLCSALLMTSTRAYLRARSMQAGPLNQVTMDINRLLCMDTAATGCFVTAFIVSVWGNKREINWVRAGHEPALLFNPETNTFESLTGKGTALGVDPHARYKMNGRVGLPAGTIVLIATDGLWETKPGQNATFGKDAVKDVVRRYQQESASNIADVLKRSVIDFHRDAPPEDDMTLVVIKFL